LILGIVWGWPCWLTLNREIFYKLMFGNFGDYWGDSFREIEKYYLKIMHVVYETLPHLSIKFNFDCIVLISVWKFGCVSEFFIHLTKFIYGRMKRLHTLDALSLYNFIYGRISIHQIGRDQINRFKLPLLKTNHFNNKPQKTQSFSTSLKSNRKKNQFAPH
jgi:hypothetical protein